MDLENWAPAGDPVLELLAPEKRLIPIPIGSTIIGRDPGPGAITLDFPGISREHVQITRSGRTASLMDLESKNGTVVNGELVRVKTLSDGDRVTLGSQVELRFAYAVVGQRKGVSLTPREREVASLVANGLTNKQIAQRLGVTRHAVDAVLRSAFKRAEVRSRAALIAWLERGE